MSRAAIATAEDAAATFKKAAEGNRRDPLLSGSMLQLPNYGQLVVTGDMHGHRANFEKLKRFSMLEHASVRHVILHEMIHTETPPGRPDESHELLLEAARYKCDFPDQVHFLQSNHELSQLTSHQILKGGRAVLEDFERGVRLTYGSGGGAVYQSILEFLASFPIAARTPNRVWISHSLPAADDMSYFDTGVFKRPLRESDLHAGGSVYSLVWGRRFTDAHVAALAQALDVDTFLIGHIPQETGFAIRNKRVIILASDHSHGVFLPFDLSKSYTADELVDCIRKFVAVP